MAARGQDGAGLLVAGFLDARAGARAEQGRPDQVQAIVDRIVLLATSVDLRGHPAQDLLLGDLIERRWRPVVTDVQLSDRPGSVSSTLRSPNGSSCRKSFLRR